MIKLFSILSLVSGLVLPSFCVDREAFTFTNYELTVRVEPEQQRLGVRGKLTLRNDSSAPQKNVALQISSTLDWSSIRIAGQTAEFVSHEYTSDIDHTGALSEAIVTLPHELPPKGTLELEIGYEGVIPLDVTRLKRIGVPEDKARHTDWDEISKSFTAVRGIGYVVWYPVATESANLSEENSVDEALGRWRARFNQAAMELAFESTANSTIFFSGAPKVVEAHADLPVTKAVAFSMADPGVSVPTFVIANYQKLAPSDLLTIEYLPGQEERAKEYAEVAAGVDPAIPAASGSSALQILGVPDPDAASFVSEGMLLCPLKSPVSNQEVLDIVYAKARQVYSPRAWIQEGLAHYAQAAFIADQAGRPAAIDYLNAHRAPLLEAEKQIKSSPAAGAVDHSLINAPDALYLQTKALAVWWMLRDMVGTTPVDALANYHATEDKDGGYMQRVIEKQYHRDLQWFFDDWVYRDRGLPDFRVDSVYPRPIVSGGWMVTVTIENLGGAGAEVPLTLRTQSAEVTRRLEVHGKSKAAIRIEVASTPVEVVVNDGSVPESDLSNNAFKIPPPDTAK